MDVPMVAPVAPKRAPSSGRGNNDSNALVFNRGLPFDHETAADFRYSSLGK